MIRKAMKHHRLTQIIYENGMVWEPSCGWNPIEYGECMSQQFDLERLLMAALLRAQANKRSKLNRIGKDEHGPIDTARLDYVNNQTVHALMRLIKGDRPEAGIGEDEGCWLVKSENNKKADVRPHKIGLDGWCDCDAVTKGRRWDDHGHGNPCHAMYMVWMYQRLISPTAMPTSDELEGVAEQMEEAR